MIPTEQIRNTIVKLLPDAIQRLSNEDYRDYGHDLSEITAFSAAVIVPRYTADRIPWAIDNRVACLETISKLLSTLGGRNSAAHRSALDASIALVQHDEVRAATFFDEMASKVISLVAHEDLHIQQGALNAVTALAYSDPLRASISGETISRILSLLHSENPNAVICALHCCISLVHYADIRKSICSPEMVFKIVSLLDAAPTTDELPTTANIRRSALDAIRAFACYVDVPLSIYPGDTISQVISRLEDQDARTQQSAFDTIANLASYDHVRAYICAKQTISQVISKLHDASWQAQLWLSNSLVVLMQYGAS
ncbi:armadillo-type protein [Mycena polygramma]|nr:armadillo-type protein [Mycena polygramma]